MKNGDRFEGSSFIDPSISHFIVLLAHYYIVRLLHRTWKATQASQNDKYCSISERQDGKYILVRSGRLSLACIV